MTNGSGRWHSKARAIDDWRNGAIGTGTIRTGTVGGADRFACGARTFPRPGHEWRASRGAGRLGPDVRDRRGLAARPAPCRGRRNVRRGSRVSTVRPVAPASGGAVAGGGGRGPRAGWGRRRLCRGAGRPHPAPGAVEGTPLPASKRWPRVRARPPAVQRPMHSANRAGRRIPRADPLSCASCPGKRSHVVRHRRP